MSYLKVPFLDLKATPSEKSQLLSSIADVLDHGQLVMGPEIFTFEEKVASYCNRNFSTSVGSGTTALVLALKALELNPSDEVITTSLSWIATANAIALNNAIPVFADVDSNLNICPDSVLRLINKNTRAIISVDYTGKLADFVRLEKICDAHNLFLIADASQAFGAQRGGRVSGSYGHISAISHNPMKVLAGIGEAGSILTDDEHLKNKFDILRYNGTINKEYLLEPSFNGRMDTVQAAVLIKRLCSFGTLQQLRQANASLYYQYLSSVDQIKLPHIDVDETHALYTFTVIAERRDELMAYLDSVGIETKIHHPILMCDQTPYQKCVHESTNASILREKILCIPIHEKLDHDQVLHVANSIKYFYNQ